MSIHVSILTTVTNTSRAFVRGTLRSVLRQTNPNWTWHWFIPSEVSSGSMARLRDLASTDSRITIVEIPSTRGFTASLNEVLSKETNTFVTFFEQSGTLPRDTVETVSATINEHPTVDVIYGDEDKIACFGRRYDRTRKPIWSPERLNCQMYFGSAVFYRAEVLRSAGLLREQFESAHPYDLALRVSEKAREISRIPQVLLHNRHRSGSSNDSLSKKNQVEALNLQALQDHFLRINLRARADPSGFPDTFSISRIVGNREPVSVIIPTRGSSGAAFGKSRVFIEVFLKSLIENSREHEDEFIVIYDSDTPPQLLERLKKIAPSQIKLVLFEGPFNFSRKCNIGAIHSSYSNLVFLNDDMECVSDQVLTQLVAPLSEPGVGITGAKLLFDDQTIQHGGHIHDSGDYRINYYGASRTDQGRFGALVVNREVSGVTGACLAIRKELFESVGGFSELFPNSYNDVDLCNKVSRAGFRILWLANAVLTHFESKSRVPLVTAEDYSRIHSRWGFTPDDYFA